MTEIGDLFIGHPASVRGTWFDDVRRDASSIVTELLSGGANDGGHRSFACSIREVTGYMIARERDDTATAVGAAEALAELTHKEPRCACVHRKMPIEALDGRTHDVAIDRLGMG